MKTNKINKKSKISTKPKSKANRKSIYTYLIISIVLVVAIIGIYFLGKLIYTTIKYGKYKDKMDEYGLNVLYDNSKATSIQSVTKSELVKVLVGSALDEDVKQLVSTENSSYDNEYWIAYAENKGIIGKGKITKDNYNEKATINDCINILTNTKYLLLQDTKKIELKGSNCNLNKGMLNKEVITMVDDNATIYYKSQYADGKQNIVTDEDKLPKNYEEYPYIVDNIPNEVYEMPFKIVDEEKYLSPKKEYEYRKDVYMQIDEYLTTYFDAILNIDYKTINEEKLLNKIKDVLYYSYGTELVKDYVKYVKDNEIQISGKVTPLLPIIYCNGEINKVRVKIELNVINSKTNINLLLPDIHNGDNIKYDGKKIEFYADIYMGEILDSQSLRCNVDTLVDYIISDNIKISRVNEGEK